jgi:transposase
MPAKYVRPYNRGQKNDFRDAEAITEAVQRPTMKFVATKTADQLDLQALHRVRQRLDPQSFAAYLAPLRKAEWFVYSKRPFGGPQAVLGYLSRYTHRIAIANSRLIAFDQQGVTFKWKDYRIEGRDRYKQMTTTVISGVDAPPVFEASEHGFDLVALSIEDGVIGDRGLAV